MKKQFKNFVSAKKYVKSLQISSGPEWNKFCKSGKKPVDIPSAPWDHYKEWKNWYDWLGTKPKSFRLFQKARKFVHSLKLKDQKNWVKFTKSGKLPIDIPATPYRVYENEGWNGLGDWLGTNTIATSKRKFTSFQKTRKFVQTLNLKSRTDWEKFAKSKKRPLEIPYSPDRTYKNVGWISWGDFLGTNDVAPQLREYLTFNEARNYVRKLKLKDQNEWEKLSKSSKFPNNIPNTPRHVYKKDWISMGDWLGTFSQHSKEFRSFSEAKRYVKSLKLKGQSDWHKYRKSGKRPEDIPSEPARTYKKEWKGWGDWLGTGNLAPKTISKNYLTFQDAREKARKLARQFKLKTHHDWNQAVKDGKIPKSIPANPWQAYSKKRVKKK